jgi:hypothetical protein
VFWGGFRGFGDRVSYPLDSTTSSYWTFGDTFGDTTQVQCYDMAVVPAYLPVVYYHSGGSISVSPKVPSPKVPKTRSDLRKHTPTRLSPNVGPRGTYGDKTPVMGTRFKVFAYT